MVSSAISIVLIIIIGFTYYLNVNCQILLILLVKLLSEILISLYEIQDRDTIIYSNANKIYLLEIISILFLNMFFIFVFIVEQVMDYRNPVRMELLKLILLVMIFYFYYDYRNWILVISEKMAYYKGKTFYNIRIKSISLKLTRQKNELEIKLHCEETIRIDFEEYIEKYND